MRQGKGGAEVTAAVDQHRERAENGKGGAVDAGYVGRGLGALRALLAAHPPAANSYGVVKENLSRYFPPTRTPITPSRTRSAIVSWPERSSGLAPPIGSLGHPTLNELTFRRATAAADQSRVAPARAATRHKSAGLRDQSLRRAELQLAILRESNAGAARHPPLLQTKSEILPGVVGPSTAPPTAKPSLTLRVPWNLAFMVGVLSMVGEALPLANCTTCWTRVAEFKNDHAASPL